MTRLVATVAGHKPHGKEGFIISELNTKGRIVQLKKDRKTEI